MSGLRSAAVVLLLAGGLLPACAQLDSSGAAGEQAPGLVDTVPQNDFLDMAGGRSLKAAQCGSETCGEGQKCCPKGGGCHNLTSVCCSDGQGSCPVGSYCCPVGSSVTCAKLYTDCPAAPSSAHSIPASNWLPWTLAVVVALVLGIIECM